ncbi:MAG: N-acetylneuraminate synthase family protein [Candidatus Promineifilaceae bacterium]
MFQQEITVRGHVIGGKARPYIIAEMACAHDGQKEKAKKLIEAAASADADAIQLQLFAVNHQVAPTHRLYELLCNLELSVVDWREIYNHARTFDLAVFAFTYDVPSLQLALEMGVDGIKLSSADLSNPEMLQLAAESSLPITLGTGASTVDEIQAALSLIEEAGGEKVILMHGVQNFPTALEDANIRHIQLLQRIFQLPVGYQDHTDAELLVSKVIDLTAVGMGACIIEKHITIDRSEKGTDYQAALEPAEFKQFVGMIRQVSAALGYAGVSGLTESDLRYRQFQKKRIVAARTLKTGTILSRQDVVFLRRDDTSGLSPLMLSELLNRMVTREIKQYELIKTSDLAD